jgi:hypothetical protein
MKVFIDRNSLGHGRVWNHCTNRHSLLGMICKEAGLTDEEIDFRMSLVLSKTKEDEKAKLPETSKVLPGTLSPFFTADSSWSPNSNKYKGSKKFKLTDLGVRLENLNDSVVSPGLGAWEATDEWLTQVEVMCAEGGVEVAWGVKPEESEE